MLQPILVRVYEHSDAIEAARMFEIEASGLLGIEDVAGRAPARPWPMRKSRPLASSEAPDAPGEAETRAARQAIQTNPA